MKKIMFSSIVIAVTASLGLAGCGATSVKPTTNKIVVLKKQPPRGTLATGKKAYFIDNKGKCSKGQIVEVTGGSRSTPRKYRCIKHP